MQVEEGLPFDDRRVGRTIDRILSDDRGWLSTGSVLARATNPSDAGVRIVLASPSTTDSLCAPLDTGGRLSCRNGSTVALNGWRWANGASSYGNEVAAYRSYLVNHEVGHALGRPHEQCPSPNATAPVMLQQTKGLGGCRPNPWPAAEALSEP